MMPAGNIDVEARVEADRNSSVELLKAMSAEPKGTQRQWAEMVGCSQTMVFKRLAKMKAEKLVDVVLSHWSLTPKGERELEKWS